MGLETPPYFPFYPRDFSSDGVVEAMSTKAVGAYTLLLCKAWFEDPAGSLPKDDVVLARWARVSDLEWSSIRLEVVAAFRDAGTRWVQKRMTTEAERALNLIAAKSKGGKAAMAVRWGSNKTAIRHLQDTNGCASVSVSVPESSVSLSSPEGGCKGETLNGSHRRLLWGEVQEIWAAYPERHRGGNRGVLGPIGEALDDLEGQGIPNPKAHLLARVAAFAGSWRAKHEGGKYTKDFRNWLADGQYNLPDSAWVEPNAKPRYVYRTKAERDAEQQGATP